jgi:AP-2 complex subunit mu-1
MASALFFVNQKGDEVVSRHFRYVFVLVLFYVFLMLFCRGDLLRTSVDTFRNKIIASKSTGSHAPVVHLDGTSFAYVRHKNLFLVAATRSNIDIFLIFEYLIQMIRILKAYLGEDFGDDALKGNFTLVYELFDETMDYGYPQNCSIDVLKLYINQGNLRSNEVAASGTALTSQITGAIDWRREGIRYRNNEVYIDVQETLTCQLSSTGQVLRSEIIGKVMMKALLSGMPECKFGLNDKLTMDKESSGTANHAHVNKAGGVELDDCTFHR